MSRTMVVHVRKKFLYISLLSSTKLQLERTKFCFFWRTLLFHTVFSLRLSKCETKRGTEQIWKIVFRNSTAKPKFILFFQALSFGSPSVIAQAPYCYCYYLKSHHNGISARAQILRSDNVLDFINILAVAFRTVGVFYKFL